MSESSTHTATLLQALLERAAAVKPEEFEHPAQPRVSEPGATVVGSMNDHHKALFTLFMRATNEKESKSRKVKDLTSQVRSKIEGGWIQSLKNFADGGAATKALLDDLEEARAQELRVHHEVEFLRIVFWNELRHSFPDLVGKAHLCVFDDWSVGHFEYSHAQAIELIIGGVGVDIAEILGGRRGDGH